MNVKSISYLTLILVIIGVGGALLFNFSKGADAQEKKLWNLQKLEAMAETGDIEAQLRLIDFYGSSLYASDRDRYKEKLEYWRLNVEAKKQTNEYIAAASKLGKEHTEEHRQRQQQEADMRARMQDMKKKYEKLGPDAKKNEAMLMHDGLNAIYNVKKIYSWKVPYIWRYRLTINIETPEGIKSGTTVQELYFPPADKNIYVSSNKGIARGEAAYVDLGNRGVIFAVLPDPAYAQNRFNSLVSTVFPTVPKVYDPSRYQEILSHYHELRGVKGEVPSEMYPMFVHFREITNPQSIELVYKRKQGSRNDMKQIDVDRLEEVFGTGVRIKNITLEMTDDPLEWKLNNKLGWIENMSEKDITRALAQADPRIQISNGIAYYIFRQGQEDPLEKINNEKKIKQEIKERLSKYKSYDDYKDIPSNLVISLYPTMTLDRYLERLKKEGYAKTTEAQAAAMRAFVTVDKNKDGVISYGESEARKKKEPVRF